MTAAANAGPPGAKHVTPAYSWFVLFVLFSVYILNFLDRQLVGILTEHIRKDLDLTDAQMGRLGGLYFALFYTVIGIPVGWLADRTNRVRILVFGCFLWSLCTFLCGKSTNYAMLAASRMGVGIGEAAGAPPSYSIISDYFPADRRGNALALFSLGVPVGQALGASFGASTAEALGWRQAFIIIGIVGIVMSALLLILVREPKRGAMDPVAKAGPAPAEEKISFFASMAGFFGRKSMLFTSLGCGTASFALYASLQWAPALLMRDKGITSGEIAVWYALMIAVMMGLGGWTSGLLVDKFAPKRREAYGLVPAAAMAISIPFFMLFVWAPTWQLGLVFLSVPTFFTIFHLAPALAVVQNFVKPSQRTISGAMLLFVLNLVGLGGGPTFVGQVSTALTPAHGEIDALKLAMYWVTPIYLLAMTFMLLEAKHLRGEHAKAKAEEAGDTIPAGL